MSSDVEHYTKICDDEWVVIRFVDELKVIAKLVGPDYSWDDAVSSADRIWPRYFGSSAVPSGFYEGIFPLLRAVAKFRSVPGRICYPLGDALYEQVAITMYGRWYSNCKRCPIPFEYWELEGRILGDGFDVYHPAFPGRGNLS